MVRFIRKNGRIVPIRDNRTPKEEVKATAKKKVEKVKEFGKAEHSKYAALGALNGITTGLFLKHRGASFSFPVLNRMAKINMKTMPPLASGFTRGLKLAAFAMSTTNAYQHGKEKKSFAHGVGRFLTNTFAFHGGNVLANAGTKKVSKIAGLIKGKKTTFSGKTFDAEIVKKGSSSVKGLPYKG